jgi:L-ascorbate metabolism protein UlaG (beta-lactamase superfamily)
MIITWLGQACFRIQSGDLTVVIDPYSKDIGLTPPRFKADVVLVTHDHYDHSNAESLAGEPMVIKGPGEYEVKDVYVLGLETFHDDVQGKERGLNTIYKVGIEGMQVAHLGDFGEKEVRDQTLEELGDVDILLIPVGGKFTIDAEGAAKAIKKIEPKIVIPMHYKIPGLKIDLGGVDEFLKEMGTAKIEAQDKLTIKKKDLGEDEKTKVILLKVS